MFTKAQVENMKDAYAEVRQYDSDLTDFFTPIIQELGWTDIDSVFVNATGVVIKVSWYGSYQNENHDVLYCPISLLTKPPAEIIAAMKEAKCTE